MRGRPDDVRAVREERLHEDVPHRWHAEHRWDQRRVCVELLAHRQRQPAGGDAACVAGGGGHSARPGNAFVPRDVYRLAEPDLEVDGQPVLRDRRFLHRPVLVRPEGVHAARLPRHGLRHRLEPVRRAALRHEGRRLRQRPLQRSRGALLGHRRRPFTDLSYDAQNTTAPWCAYAPYGLTFCDRAPNAIHPDQHVIAINPSNPTQIFEGSDGGLIRTSGTFTDLSAQCDTPGRNGGGPLPPTSGSYTACKRLLSRAPTLIEHIDKKLSSTLQFINVAINPSDHCKVTGGTQDNGTWSNLDGCNNKTWTQIIYGDGGNAGYDATEPTWRFNEFTSGFSDSNFRDGDPERWVITSAPVVNSGEGPAFYWPQIGDPNPVPGTHPIYSGAKHVWRTWAFGAGHPRAVPQDASPDIAGYEANCPEFVVSGAHDGCGDYRSEEHTS